jgi:hypothetical protein
MTDADATLTVFSVARLAIWIGIAVFAGGATTDAATAGM